MARRFLGFLPSNNVWDPPLHGAAAGLGARHRDRAGAPWQTQRLIVAQQLMVLASALQIDALDKAARFVCVCDAFKVPLVTLLDVPGSLPGVAQEHGGIIRHGAKLLCGYCEATVPKAHSDCAQGVRVAHGVLSSKLRGDSNLAWLTAEIAVVSVEGAVNAIFRERLARASEPDAQRQVLVREYSERFAHQYMEAARGYLDDVIGPSETRPRLIRSLEMLSGKRQRNPARKHGNIPLRRRIAQASLHKDAWAADDLARGSSSEVGVRLRRLRVANRGLNRVRWPDGRNARWTRRQARRSAWREFRGGSSCARDARAGPRRGS